MPQGGHQGGTAEGGEELDEAQKLVKKFLASTISNSRRAAATRQRNQEVERSLIGQQPGLAQADIRPYLRRPTGSRRNGAVPNANPFRQSAESNVDRPPADPIVPPNDHADPIGPSNRRPPAPRRTTNQANQGGRRQQPHPPSNNILDNNPDNAILVKGVINEETRNLAASV